MEIYRDFVSPLLDKGDSETWHVRTRQALHKAEKIPGGLWVLDKLNPGGNRFTDPRLNVTIAGINYDNPVMVGAGWDKVGEAVRALYTLGFSGVEVGTVLENPQEGNPKPRQFMVAPGVALNRLGFNSPGMDVVRENLWEYSSSGIPIGISLGKNKDMPDTLAPHTHATVAHKLHDYASYFAINVSSPNTPGLRRLQDKQPLTDIATAVQDTMKFTRRKVPIFIKIAPDLTTQAVDDVIDVVTQLKLAGIIAANTTVDAELKAKYHVANEMGGLSGDDPEFRRMSTEQIRHIYRATKGEIELIGIGGVKDATTAIEKIEAGAKLVQVMTGIRGEGPGVAGRINRGLVYYMDQLGIKNIQELVGVAA